MTGFLNHWPTLLIIAMFPILTIIYGRLSMYAGREVEGKFGKTAGRVLRFVKRLGTITNG